MRPVDIIIPTWNNPEFLNPCVDSIIKTGILHSDARLLIVNNGTQDIKSFCGHLPNIEVLEPGRNLGWEGGLAYALERSDAQFVCFQNDDTIIPRANMMFYQQMLVPFMDKSVAAVGPTTTCAAGAQSIYHPECPRHLSETTFLIFFTVMVRRAHLDEVGGIDTTLAGGDDFDLSIRFRKAGRRLLINPDCFLIHHGFKTGTRLRGDHTTAGGWNSPQMQERTNIGLIRKHGFKTFLSAFGGILPQEPAAPNDLEGDVVRTFVTGINVLELGCGGKKTIPHAVGIDHVAKGETCTHLNDQSVADVQADVQQPLPFADFSQDSIIARHILEHCIDQIKTIKQWNRVLRLGGRLVVAVPDEQVTHGIPMNPEHCHAYTQESLANLMESCGFKTVGSKYTGNWVSFVGCYEKVLHMAPLKERELVNA